MRLRCAVVALCAVVAACSREGTFGPDAGDPDAPCSSLDEATCAIADHCAVARAYRANAPADAQLVFAACVELEEQCPAAGAAETCATGPDGAPYIFPSTCIPRLWREVPYEVCTTQVPPCGSSASPSSDAGAFLIVCAARRFD